MAQLTITQLPQAQPLAGTESVPISQNGLTVQTTVAAIANSPTQQQTFITVNQEVTLPNSRRLQGGTGVGLTDTGSLGAISITLNGASGSLEVSTNGIIAKTSGNTVVGRTLIGSSTGVTVTNGDGVAGNPVIALNGPVGTINGLGGSGLLTLQNGTSVGSVSIQGTANQISVANSNGLSGNPTVGLADNPVIPGVEGMVIPVGTTAERPVGVNGEVRYNSTTAKFEGYRGGSWQDFGGGDGTVTSVNVSGGSTGLTTSGGPITTSGTITLDGTLAITNGGTGQTSAQGAINALAGSVASGQYLRGDGTNVVMSTIQVSDVPQLNQNTTGQAGSVANAVTFNSTGGAAAGTTYNGSVARTIDYSSVGAPKADGTGATGTWGINISGNAATATAATNVADGAANRIVYQQGFGSTTFVVAPTVTDTFLKWNGSAFVWGAIAGAGTVTSVDVSGGTTGLTTSGGPITSSGSITLAGTLNVANGGTGTTSLTGYVKGNGTSAMTASAAIPNTDITGLGSMSTQSASSVAITGGSIDGATIGGTTPAAGTFTSVAMTSGTITTAPTNGNDIVNKTYADSIAAGINFHQAVKYATTAALPASTYNNGTSGVGATITANANGALTVDGYTFTSPADNGTRILVKNQANAAYNGVYTLTQAGNAGAPFILTRATDFNTPGTGVNQIDAGDFFLVTAGTANANTSWVQQTPLPITMGTTGIVFSQFGAPLTYSAGTGLTESPAYTFNIATTGVSAATYGSSSSVPVIAVNAQGQITTASNSSIAIAGSQITSGTIGSSYISGSYTGITGVGTLTAGTWNATTIGVGYGGTGLTTYANGDLIYASGATTLSKLALGTSGQVLTAGASAPQYVNQSTLSVGSAATATTAGSVTNAVTFNNGGAGAASGTTFDGSAARTISYNTIGAPSTSGTNATGTWGISISGNAATATSATSATTATTATNISGGATGSLVYQSAASTTTTLALGTTNFVLTAGASAPQYVAQSTLSVGSATNATNTAVTANSTNATNYLTFVSATTGNLGQLVNSAITCNPSTGAITGGISGGTF
jgi:hypothetical protein